MAVGSMCAVSYCLFVCRHTDMSYFMTCCCMVALGIGILVCWPEVPSQIYASTACQSVDSAKIICFPLKTMSLVYRDNKKIANYNDKVK